MTLAYNADSLFLYRTTNARAGDGAGSVPEFIQKLFRYNVGFEYGCRKKGVQYEGNRAMDGWRLIFMMDNGVVSIQMHGSKCLHLLQDA